MTTIDVQTTVPDVLHWTQLVVTTVVTVWMALTIRKLRAALAELQAELDALRACARV